MACRTKWSPNGLGATGAEGESKKKKWHVAPSGHQMALVRQVPVAPTLPGNGLQQMLFNSSKPNLYLAAGGLEQKQATSSPSLRTHLLQIQISQIHQRLHLFRQPT